LKHIADEIEKWGKVIRAAGIKLQEADPLAVAVGRIRLAHRVRATRGPTAGSGVNPPLITRWWITLR
jgi:hypothetical protein